jgi:serine/threonine protein kinase
LQVLKESISGRHKLVLLHLATIHHGPERYLLLPYAELGDLYQFLHCGMGVERKRKYNFAEQFRGIEDSDLAEPLVRQASGIASAIDWLHSGITVGETLGKIYCAHMDLKPDNILIRASETSIVGEWVLSDFGISVVKTKGVDADVGSIQDWLTQATMNTRPRRIGGTYQAPEVELSQELNLTDTQHGIGKKSDIWSYGCILSEVLAFALNKATSVSEFQRERKGVRGDDKFYEENNDRINVPGTKTFRLRSSVRMWLERQRDVSKSPPTWVSCWVRAIYDILVVDARTRPNSAELMRLLTKLVKHVKNSSAGRMIPCEFCQNRDSTSLGGNGRRSPIIPEGLNINYNPRHAGGHLLGDFNTSYPILSGEASSASASPMSETFHRRFNSLPTKSPQPSADSLLAHGIVMSPAGQRTSKKPVVVHTRESTHAAHAVAIAYFEDQTFVASLEKQSIVLQTLDVDNCSVLKALDGTTIHLETDRYRSLALAGPYLAAWHFSSSKLVRTSATHRWRNH